MFPVNDIQTDRPLYIRELQGYLRQLSRRFSTIPTLNVDGYFGPATGRSVAAFQQRFGLPVNRIADRATWDSIVAEYRRMQNARQPQPSYAGSPPRLPLRAGDTGGSVAQLREWLHLLGLHFRNLPEVSPGDIYDPATVRAVTRMQRLMMLPVSGVTDWPTWRGIAAAFSMPRIGFPAD